MGTHTLNLAILYVVTDLFRAPAIYLAASAESSSQNFQNSALKFLGHRLEPHLARDLDDLVERDGLCVLDVLLLLAVTRGLLERLDNQRGSGGNDGDGSLTVLDGEPHGHAKTFL